MDKWLHIIGAGGSAIEIAQAAELSGYRIKGYFVEEQYLYSSNMPVKHIEELHKLERPKVICSISDPGTRARLIKEHKHAEFVNIAHPRAIYPEYLIGHGCYIGAGAVISPQTIFGSHVQVHNGAIIGHETRIADCSTVLPGSIISGRCFIGYQSVIGAGAKVAQDITVGAQSMVGMGSVVIRDVKEGTVVVGIPAREIPAENSQANGKR